MRWTSVLFSSTYAGDGTAASSMSVCVWSHVDSPAGTRSHRWTAELTERADCRLPLWLGLGKSRGEPSRFPLVTLGHTDCFWADIVFSFSLNTTQFKKYTKCIRGNVPRAQPLVSWKHFLIFVLKGKLHRLIPTFLFPFDWKSQPVWHFWIQTPLLLQQQLQSATSLPHWLRVHYQPGVLVVSGSSK